MTTLQIQTDSADYEVRIGSGMLPELGPAVREATGAKKCVLVSGENVFPLYGEAALNSLRNAGIKATEIVFPAGEQSKSLETYGRLLCFAAEQRLSRTDCLIALGGGVTGDLTGFAAASYQRGIPYVQVPTTLLAAVDSSVGGKTAINLPAGKNQAGAFWQPALVLCDPDTLQTLPERERNAGFAEVIKYAVLGDADLFDTLQKGREKLNMEEVIETCIRRKAEIVAEDERDSGRRRMLNLGHSFGHAVESRSNYNLLHGEAVAIGLAMIARAAVRLRSLDPLSRDVILDLLREYGLPTETEYLPEELLPQMLLDKKFSHGLLHLIVPRSIGWCEDVPVTAEELPSWLEAAYA